MSTRAPEAPAKGTGLVLVTLAAGQFLMTLDSSVMNVSIATVAKDVGTTVTGIQAAITLYTLVMAIWMPDTVVPTSLATVAMDTFMTELSRVIRNCPAARVSRTSPVPLAGASGVRVLTASASISSQPHHPQSWAATRGASITPKG